METQIYSYLKSPKGTQVITIFGYASRGVPGIEINGCGKLSKNIKEKLIYLTRTRKMSIPTRRFVLCVEMNDLDIDIKDLDLKWIEYPLLILFWYLAGLIPIKKLDDCICSGWINANGEIFQSGTPIDLSHKLLLKTNPVKLKNMKLITSIKNESHDLRGIDSKMLLEHIPQLNFKLDYMDKDSATPINSCIA